MAPPAKFVLQGRDKKAPDHRGPPFTGRVEPATALKILVIDDDAAVMTLINATLRVAGYSVIPAYGGLDAIRKAKIHKPALVLTDLEMPGINGVELIAALRADPETDQIPIVAVTSHVWDVIAQSAGQKGCDAYLSKPFLPKQLIEMVHRFLPPLLHSG